MAEPADAHDSKSCGEIRVGSTPTFGTVVSSLAPMPFVTLVKDLLVWNHCVKGTCIRSDIAEDGSLIGYYTLSENGDEKSVTDR